MRLACPFTVAQNRVPYPLQTLHPHPDLATFFCAAFSPPTPANSVTFWKMQSSTDSKCCCPYRQRARTVKLFSNGTSSERMRSTSTRQGTNICTAPVTWLVKQVAVEEIRVSNPKIQRNDENRLCHSPCRTSCRNRMALLFPPGSSNPPPILEPECRFLSVGHSSFQRIQAINKSCRMYVVLCNKCNKGCRNSSNLMVIYFSGFFWTFFRYMWHLPYNEEGKLIPQKLYISVHMRQIHSSCHSFAEIPSHPFHSHITCLSTYFPFPYTLFHHHLTFISFILLPLFAVPSRSVPPLLPSRNCEE